MKVVSRSECTVVLFLVHLKGSIILNYLLDTDMAKL